MRRSGWLAVMLPVAGLCLVTLAGEMPVNPSTLWVLPFSVSIASTSLLLADVLLGNSVQFSVPRRILSGAYLMNGPSLALLSISTSFGFATPTWVTCATPLLLPMAAWAYYRLLGPLEDDSVGISKEHEQTADWI